MKRKYWYKFEYHECPVCGRGKTYKERMFTRKPKLAWDRHIWVPVYDNCLEF